MGNFYVYILSNKNDTTLYVEVTNNLVKRIYEHKSKLISGFTKRYNLTKLVYFEVLDDPENAIKREKTIKNLVRRKKDVLINSTNPNWIDLYPELMR